MLTKTINELTGSFDEVKQTIEQTFSDDKNLSLKETQIYYELISLVDSLKEIVLFPKDSKHLKNNAFIEILSKNLSIIFETNNKNEFQNIIRESKNLIDALNNSVIEGFKKLREEQKVVYDFSEIHQTNTKSIKRR